MRVVLQRVSRSSIEIDNKEHAAIGAGLLILLGIEETDTLEDLEYLTGKIAALRVFPDQEGKMNLDIRQVSGEVLVVSQFTLYGSTKKGNRPSFIRAARPEHAIPLYEQFIARLHSLSAVPCRSGIFGADMQVHLVNDGPVTIVMDSRNRE